MEDTYAPIFSCRDERGEQWNVEMLEERLRKLSQGNMKEVDEEEIHEYPLLAGNSIMHFYSSPTGPEDFPGSGEREKRWQELAEHSTIETDDPTRNHRAPQIFAAEKLSSIHSIQERHWAAQLEFIEEVLQNPKKHVIGYWSSQGQKARTLDTLCTCNKYAAVMTRNPIPQIGFHCDYKSLWEKVLEEPSNLTDKFDQIMCARKNIKPEPKKANLDKFDELCKKHGGRLATVYLLDFSPMDLELVRLTYPEVRIVGLTTPGVADEAAQLQILRIRDRLYDKKLSLKEKGLLLKEVGRTIDEAMRILSAACNQKNGEAITLEMFSKAAEQVAKKVLSEDKNKK